MLRSHVRVLALVLSFLWTPGMPMRAQEPPDEEPPPAEAPAPETPAPEAGPAPEVGGAPEAGPATEGAAVPEAVTGEAPAGEEGEEGEPAAEAGPPEPRLDRITFELPLAAERGGGTIAGAARSLEFKRATYVELRGEVEVKYRDLVLRADAVDVDLETKTATATGNVILDEGPRRMSGATLEFDLEAKTGSVTEASAFVDPDMYFRGDVIRKLDDRTYTVTNGMFTACEGEHPAWSFHAGRVRLTVDGYAKAHNARMHVKRLPVLYTPFIMVPVKPERTSGLLFPNFGNSQRRGTYLGLAYYQVLGKSYDDTVSVDLYSKDFFGLGNEFRYRPTEFTEGNLQAYAVDDPEQDAVRWKIQWSHKSNKLPLGFRGAISYVDFSDFDFFRDFERDFNRISIRSLYSRAFASKNWGAHSVNFLVDNRETFINDEIVRQNQLPELEYSMRQTRLGHSPLYLQLRSSAHYFSIERSDTLKGDYGRFDILPQFTLPFRAAPWLSLSASASSRLTVYSDSLDDTGQAFSGDGLTRFFPSAGGEIIGPSFSRIFNKGMGSFAKFKHVIEPRWTYSYLGEFDEAELVPRFDEIDRSPRATSIFVASVSNRLLGKPRDESEGSAREIMSLELSQAVSLRNDRPLQVSKDGTLTSQRSPIDLRFRFNPSSLVSVQAQSSFNTLFNRLASASITGSYAWGEGGSNVVGLSWITRFDPEKGRTRTNQVRFGTGLDIVRNRLRFDTSVSVDLNANSKQPNVQQQRYIMSYNGSCYGFRVEFQEYRSTNRQDTNVRLAITLKHIGSFIDLTGGQSSLR